MPKRAHTIDRPFPGGEIDCVILAPESFRRKALYALETLLRPHGVRPVEGTAGNGGVATSDSSAAGPTGIWYGAEPPETGDWLFVRLDPQTPRNITSSFRGILSSGDRGGLYLFPGGIDGAGDPIASAFYWLAGCDYLANPGRDQYGRVTWAGSLLDSLGLTDTAPVDRYSEQLMVALRPSGDAGSNTVAGKSATAEWSLCPTFDIDYLRKWRPDILYREFIEYAVLGRGPVPRWPRVAHSLRDALRPGDPYRTALERILEELTAVDGTGTFFFKGGATSAHDVSYSLQSRFVRRLTKAMASGGHEVGLHPSFHAYNHPGYLEKETRALARVTGAPPTTVRTHYLRWEEPVTPTHLQLQGFDLDSTLGFPDHSGFRNGTCRPFQVWDHGANRKRDLWEVPLAMMESSLFNREGLGPDRALERTQALMETAKRFGGTLVCLWHNILWDEPDFAGWGEHFVATLEAGKAAGARITSLSEARSRYR